MCDLDLLGTELLEFSTCNTDIPKALRFFWKLFTRSQVFYEIFILVQRLLNNGKI